MPGFRHIGVVRDEYAVDRTGAKMFGLMVLDQGMHGASFALGIRNSHDKSFRLSITVGYQVFVCQNMAFQGDFEPVLAKHSKNFSLQNALSIGVDSMQRNFKPMVEAVDRWRDSQLSDVSAKLLIYQAFVEGELEVPHYSTAASTICTSTRRWRNSSHARCGASRTRLLAPSKSSIPFRSSKRQGSWPGFSKPRPYEQRYSPAFAGLFS